MDMYNHNMPTLKRPSSEIAFGKWSLEPTNGKDEVPAGIFFRSPLPNNGQKRLLRHAHQSLLHKDAKNILEIQATDESFLPENGSRKVLSVVSDYEKISTRKFKCEGILQDLNELPTLPFEDEIFDAVTLPLEVGTLRYPIEVFREVSRVLRPGGVFIVTFIHSFYRNDLTRMWTLGDDYDHLVLADAFFEYSHGFTKHHCRTLYREKTYTRWLEHAMVPVQEIRDYVYLFWGYKDFVPERHKNAPPYPKSKYHVGKSVSDVKFATDGTPICPHCGERTEKMSPPVTVFEIDYGVSLLHVCFNDACPYYMKSRSWMKSQGQPGFTYRFMYNPENHSVGPIPDDLMGNLATSKIQ